MDFEPHPLRVIRDDLSGSYNLILLTSPRPFRWPHRDIPIEIGTAIARV